MSARARPPKHVPTLRRLQLEPLESRQLMAVEIVITGPVVSSFPTSAAVSGLELGISSQPTSVRTIDSSAMRQVLREIDGVLYSVQGNLLFETSTTTGATQTRTLTPLGGSTQVRVRDVAQINGDLVLVGASLQENGSANPTPRATRWDVNGIATAVGPSNLAGELNFVSAEGFMGGYYQEAGGQYVPFLQSTLGTFPLAGSTSQTGMQMITGASASGYFLSGVEGDWPTFWRADASPLTGNFELIFSAEIPLLYPTDASTTNSAAKFRIAEDSFGSAYIFGEYQLPVRAGAQVIGHQSYAAMWSISGDLVYDFGADSEMRGVQNVDASYIVAHRNSISLVDVSSVPQVTTVALSSLLPGGLPAGTSLEILPNGLILLGNLGEYKLGINYTETFNGQSQNKLVIVPLKNPDMLELDIDADGAYDVNFFGIDMRFPVFEPLGYGQRNLNARVTYSDGSTALAVTSYQSLRFEAFSEGAMNVLRFGGTAGNDTATLTRLGNKSYQASIASVTQTFNNIDQVVLNLSSGNDTAILGGGIVVDLAWLRDVETIDLRGSTADTLNGVEPIAAQFQVGLIGTLTIKADPIDIVDLGDQWQLLQPELVDGTPTSRLRAADTTVLLQSGRFTNPLNHLDTTFDGFITPRDALVVINHINQVAGGLNPAVDAYLDVSSDGFITPLDVLLIINHINTFGSGEGELELELAALELAALELAALELAALAENACDGLWVTTDLETVERRQ